MACVYADENDPEEVKNDALGKEGRRRGMGSSAQEQVQEIMGSSPVAASRKPE